ncbi:helix-turn-helix domain-containing protein [Fodinibius sediminis]|uniref:AraC-type DNA-binding protein n=1 Tax=Fodinibius sediminis TaxID=1214077 RepID=A0A521F5Z3_9BACT|nr:helix-turn-helix domain-containing protein [Fodinibius sediminis]SMO91615.1 AraC-type DNA-binding protein [Fodinibius sediminis]
MHDFTLPSERLAPYVKRIYEVDIPRPSTFAENQIIPLGTGTITILLKGESRIKSINGIQHGPNFTLSGQYFPTFSFASNRPLLFYGIALKPMATYKLFDIYLADIQNDFIPLDEVVGEEAKQLRQNLLQTDSTEDRFSLLKNFLQAYIPASPTYNHLDVVIDYIYAQKGILKVKDLCDYEDVSRRYLEKRFKKHIGFSPGQFIRQVRFNFTCSEIAAANTDDDVDEILMTFGYYDRSHFMKKFRKYHGGDLRVLTGDQPNLFKAVFSKIMRSDFENSYHP